MLAHLRKAETYADLGAGCDISTTAAWRYAGETVELQRYCGIDGLITPYKEHDEPESQKQANRAHARLRAPVNVPTLSSAGRIGSNLSICLEIVEDAGRFVTYCTGILRPREGLFGFAAPLNFRERFRVDQNNSRIEVESYYAVGIHCGNQTA